jgi:hypothetical protein
MSSETDALTVPSMPGRPRALVSGIPWSPELHQYLGPWRFAAHGSTVPGRSCRSRASDANGLGDHSSLAMLGRPTSSRCFHGSSHARPRGSTMMSAPPIFALDRGDSALPRCTSGSVRYTTRRCCAAPARPAIGPATRREISDQSRVGADAESSSDGAAASASISAWAARRATDPGKIHAHSLATSPSMIT